VLRVYARTGTLNKQFTSSHLNDGETVDEFSIHILDMVNQLALLAKTIQEKEVVRKFLEVVLHNYMQIDMPIDSLRHWWIWILSQLRSWWAA
jgi:hypothetical protein